MKKIPLLDEKTLDQIHPFFIPVFVILLSIPIFIMTYSSIDIGNITEEAAKKQYLENCYWSTAHFITASILLLGCSGMYFAQQKKFLALQYHYCSFILLVIFAFIFSMYAPQKFLYYVPEVLILCIYFWLFSFTYLRTLHYYPRLLAHGVGIMASTQLMLTCVLIFGKQNVSINYLVHSIDIMMYAIIFSCLIIYYIFSYHNHVNTQKKLEQSHGTLEYMAYHDDLTNLYNRREFEHVLQKTMIESTQTYTSFALLLIDIDNFKWINDNLGHAHGDLFLKDFTKILLSLTRKEDIISRIGGDEFTIIVKNFKSHTTIEKFVQRLVHTLSFRYTVDSLEFITSVSIGIAVYPIDGMSCNDLIKAADAAMYHAKKLGKNHYQFHNMVRLQQQKITNRSES